MKFVAFASLIAAAAAAASASSDNSLACPNTMSTQILLNGSFVNDEASNEDVELISKALLSSYNEIHWDSDIFMDTTHDPIQVAIPSAVGQRCNLCEADDRATHEHTTTTGLYVTMVTPLRQRCNLCEADDRSNELIMSSSTHLCRMGATKSNLEQIEASVCEKIQQSGSANLAHVRSCYVNMVSHEDDGQM